MSAASSAPSNAFVMKCDERCKERCICSEQNLLMMTSVQVAQESLAAVAPARLGDYTADASQTAATRINGATDPNSNTSILRNRYKKLKEEEDTRCLCHEKPKPTDRKARNKLIAACTIVFLFMIGEVIGKFSNKVISYCIVHFPKQQGLWTILRVGILYC